MHHNITVMSATFALTDIDLTGCASRSPRLPAGRIRHMTKYDPDRPFFDDESCESFYAIDPKTARRYGKIVKARELANMEYKHRYQKLKSKKNMKPPPSTGRIFPGYLVIRNLYTEGQYETWMPNHVFHELYSSDGEVSVHAAITVIPSNGKS